MAGARDYNRPPPFFSSPRPFNHQIQESAAAKAYDAEWKWLTSPEAKQHAAAAKALALSDFRFGPSKVNPPNSHPSNPVHKQATEAQGLARPATPATQATPPVASRTPATPPAPEPEPVDAHHVNKALVGVGALAFVGLIIYASS